MKRKLMAIICAASLVFSCGAVAFADETEGGGREGEEASQQATACLERPEDRGLQR